MVVGIILLLYYGVATLFDYRRYWYPTVRVDKESVLRAGPGIEYPVVGTVRVGDVVRVLQTKLGWRQIGAGWMAEKDLQHAAMSSKKEA